MPKLTGGKPGTWHAGLVPGASAPFRVQFDARGEADITKEESAYLRSVHIPYGISEDEVKTDEQEEDLILDNSENVPSTEPSDTKPKSRNTRRNASLD